MTFKQWCEQMLSEDAEFKHVPLDKRWEWYENHLERIRPKAIGMCGASLFVREYDKVLSGKVDDRKPSWMIEIEEEEQEK